MRLLAIHYSLFIILYSLIITPLCLQGRIWWERVDSDHRSETQQIYSLPPLATREHSHNISINKKLELVDGLEPPTC